MPLTEAKPVIAPSRGCANHQFTGGYDLMECMLYDSDCVVPMKSNHTEDKKQLKKGVRR